MNQLNALSKRVEVAADTFYLEKETPNKDEGHHGFSEEVRRGARCQV